jgi:hypothetical protein
VRRRAAAAESHPDRCEVVVNIQKAFHLPERSGGTSGGGGARSTQRGGGVGGGGYGRGGYADDIDGGRGGGGGGSSYGGELSPFVEVTFQGTTVRTRVASGSSPSWQESLVLPFRPAGNDFSPAALQASSDVVNIVLFDEHIEEGDSGGGGGGRRSTTGSGSSGGEMVTTRHYLGCIDIPVAALYRADGAKLEGVLPLEQPPVLLGYTTAPGGGGGGGGGGAGGSLQRQGGMSVQARPSLSVYIQFNPTLAKPEPGPSDSGGGLGESQGQGGGRVNLPRLRVPSQVVVDRPTPTLRQLTPCFITISARPPAPTPHLPRRTRAQ